jgi:hypothetical protein
MSILLLSKNLLLSLLLPRQHLLRLLLLPLLRLLRLLRPRVPSPRSLMSLSRQSILCTLSLHKN